MKAYSQDLRLRMLRAIDAGASQSRVAEQFAVSVPTIKRSLRQRRENGHVLPKAIRGRPSVKGAALQAHPDLRREEHCRLFKEAHGIQVSPASITRARQALGWTRKKGDKSKRAKGSRTCRLAQKDCSSGS